MIQVPLPLPSTLETAKPTDQLPSTSPSALYPHSVTSAANTPSRFSNALTSSSPLPDGPPRGRSSGTPHPSPAKQPHITPIIPHHSMTFTHNPDPGFTEEKRKVLSTLQFPTSIHEHFNFHFSLYDFVPTDLQPVPHPATLASCNISRNTKATRPFYSRDVATGLGRPGVGQCLLLPIVSGNFVRLDGLPEQCMQRLQAST